MAPNGDLDAQAILDAAPDGTLVVDGDGHIVYANQKARDLFAVDPSQLVGRSLESLVPSELRAKHVQHRASYAARPRLRAMGQQLDLSAARSDGSSFPVEVSLSPLDIDDGSLVIASIRDITSRAEAEAELRAAHESLVLTEERSRIARDRARHAARGMMLHR